MPRKTPLAAVPDVPDDDKPAKKTKEKAQSVSEAADSEDPRALLVALRNRISKDIDSVATPARDLAALSRRLLEIAREIEAIDAEEAEEADADEEPEDEAYDGTG